MQPNTESTGQESAAPVETVVFGRIKSEKAVETTLAEFFFFGPGLF